MSNLKRISTQMIELELMLARDLLATFYAGKVSMLEEKLKNMVAELEKRLKRAKDSDDKADEVLRVR